MIQVRTKTTETTWKSSLRLRVNDSVLHQGKIWTNKTGINSEPSSSDLNWELVIDKTNVNPIVIVNGNPFYLVKHPSNNNPELSTILQINDFITNGFWDATQHWDKAQLIANDGSTITDWNIIRRTKDIIAV